MSRGRFSGGLLGFIDGIKSGKDVVELCTEMSKTEAGMAGLNALAALLGVGTAASLSPAALPLTVGAVSVTAAVKFSLWWQNEQEKKNESAKLTDVQAILRAWQSSASGGWDRLDEEYGPLDDSVKQNVVGFIEALLKYELEEVKESIDALTTRQEVRFQQMAEQMAKFQRQNHHVFASLKSSLDDSLGNSLVELIAGANASPKVRAEMATSLGPRLRTLLEMPVVVEAGLKRIEDSLKPRILLHNPRPSRNLTELNRLRYEQRWTKLVGVEEPLQKLREFCSGEDFSWLILTAPGGCGKSRLAQELCDELWLSGWNAGFYDGVKNLDSWRELKPERPTLIVVDYLWAKLEDWPDRIRVLKDYYGEAPIRLLILERPADVSAWNGLISGCPEALDSYAGPKPEAYKIDALELPGLEKDEDIWALMNEVWAGNPIVKFEQVFLGPTAGYRKLDPLGRPLIAILAAVGIQVSEIASFSWNLDLITQAIVRRILERWAEAGVDDNHIRLLLLATISEQMDLRTQPNLEGLPPIGNWVESQCRQISAYTDEFNPLDPVIPALRPDPLGEAFAIYCLKAEDRLCWKESNPEHRKTLAREVCDWAVRHRLPAVQDFVRRTLGDYPNSKTYIIPCLAEAESLELSNLEISSLESLSELKNLKHLSLDMNQISDLGPLSQLTNLNTLKLNGNKISNIYPLQTLENLRTLMLNGNQIEDISPLQNLRKMVTLGLDENQVSDLGPISNLRYLQSLSLNSNQIADLRPLNGLRQLHTLSLDHNQIVNVRPLGRLSNLIYLMLNRNRIADVRPLSMLNELSLLYLCDNEIVTIGDLSSLRNLDALHIRGNRVSGEQIRIFWRNIPTCRIDHKNAPIVTPAKPPHA